jgi:TPR repeat protein
MRLSALMLLAFLLLPVVAIAGPFEDGKAASDRRDYKTALELWQPLATQGNAEAQTKIGFLYLDGFGVRQDKAKAMKWFKKAAEQGNKDAQWRLGWIYEQGEGVTIDYPEALRWLRAAADQGDERAQADIGEMSQGYWRLKAG